MRGEGEEVEVRVRGDGGACVAAYLLWGALVLLAGPGLDVAGHLDGLGLGLESGLGSRLGFGLGSGSGLGSRLGLG